MNVRTEEAASAFRVALGSPGPDVGTKLGLCGLASNYYVPERGSIMPNLSPMPYEMTPPRDTEHEAAEPRVRALADVHVNDYDFLDLGAGTGDSTLRCQEKFGGRGLGIDIDDAKIAWAQQHGRDVVKGDILSLPRHRMVRFVTMDNLLEHLPSLDAVFDVLAVAADIASEFIYIRHPSFEDEAYLRSLGLKYFWADWTGHKTHVLISDFLAIFRRLGLGLSEISYVHPVSSSTDASILPISAPPDQGPYDAALHDPKPRIEFDKPVYLAIDIIVPTSPAGNSVALCYSDDPADERPSINPRPRWSELAQGNPELDRRIESLETAVDALDRRAGALSRRKAIRIADALGALARARSAKDIRTSLVWLGRGFGKVKGENAPDRKIL